MSEFDEWVKLRKPDEPDFVGCKSSDPDDHPDTPCITSCYHCGKTIKGEWFGFGTDWIVEDSMCDDCGDAMADAYERERDK